MMRSGNLRGFGVCLVVCALLAVACADSGDGVLDRAAAPADPPAGSPLLVADPAPEPAGDIVDVSGDGAVVERGGTVVEVPAGALEAGTVSFSRPAGVVGVERFGPAVGIDHSAPLTAPVTVRWDISELPEDERATLVLARWDEQLAVWVPDTDAATYRIDGDVLVASITEFSFWDWVAGVGQSAGELTGARRDAPRCSGQLHDWVTNVVDPDEGTAAAAIRVCFEPDRDEIITARVVNNRPFTQRLDMRDGNQQWAWTWPGPDDLGVSGAVYAAARTAFDSPKTHLMPPLTESAVGIGRPGGGGAHHISASSSVDAVTIGVDLVVFLFDKITPGGFDNPMLDVFVGLLFECGGAAWLDQPGGVVDIARAVLETLATCAAEILKPSSAFGDRYEQVLLQRIAASSNPDRLVKANRWLRELAGAVKVLEFGKVAFYLSDQLQNAAVADLVLAVSGHGRPGGLGDWTATCSDLAADSNQLYRNLTLREPFTDTSRELRDYPELGEMAPAAAKPLAVCDEQYRARLAQHLPTDWGDPEAARIVAATFAPARSTLVLRPDGLGDLRLGMTIAQAQATGLLDATLGEGCPLHGEDERWAPLRDHDATVTFINDELVYLWVRAGIATDPGGVRPGDRLDDAVAAWRGAGLEVYVDRTTEEVFGVWIVSATRGDEPMFGSTVDPATRVLGGISAPFQTTCD